MTVDRIADDETAFIPRMGRPRPVPTLLAALAAALITALLWICAQQSSTVFAGAVLLVQVVLVATWCLATRPPGVIGVAVVGAGTAVASDAVAAFSDEVTIGPLAGVVAAAFGATVVAQLVRGVARRHVTTAFGSAMTLVVAVVSLATMVSLHRQSGGVDLLGTCLVAAGAGLVVARLTDLVLPTPAVHYAVPRGIAGIAAGSLIGAGVAAFSAALTDPLSPPLAALAGWGVALAGILADLGVGYASAGRALVGDEPAPSPLRPLLGPLLGIAVAAPAGYVFGLILLT